MFTGMLQPSHLIIVLVVALVFLGPKRIPEAGRALGQGLKEFKSSIGGGEDEHRQLATHEAGVEVKAPSTDATSEQ
jgi:sec-independent protein translocase protein TatA